MGTTNQVYVSPGVYTSETDLTFVAQSVGVTTLGLVGETLKGPAFEPVLISSYDDFRTYFGSTDPSVDGNGNPKYELPYFAYSYLQESNQLFVTKILGLTGYLPVTTFAITTLGGLDIDLTQMPSENDGTLTGVDTCDFYSDLSGKTATTGESVFGFISGHTYSDGDWFTIGLVPSGSTSSLSGTKVTGPIGDVTNFAWYNKFFYLNGENEVAGIFISFCLFSRHIWI